MRAVTSQVIQGDPIAIRRPDQSLANGQVVSRDDLKHFIGNDDVEIYKVNTAAPKTKPKSHRGISGARIGSFDNIHYKPGGGHTQIYHENLDWSRTQGGAVETVFVQPEKSPRVIYTSGGFIRRPSDDVFLKANNGHADVLKIHNVATPETGMRTSVKRASLTAGNDGKIYIEQPDNITTLPVLQTADARQPLVLMQNPRIRSKVGSLDNIHHRGGGGHTKVFHEDRDWTYRYDYNDRDKNQVYYQYEDATPRSRVLTTAHSNPRQQTQQVVYEDSTPRVLTNAYSSPRQQTQQVVYEDATPRVLNTAYSSPRQQTQQVVYEDAADATPRVLNTAYSSPRQQTQRVVYEDATPRRRQQTQQVVYEDATPRVLTTAYNSPRQPTQQVVYADNVAYNQPQTEDVVYYQYPSNQRTPRVISSDELKYYYPDSQVIEQYPSEASRFPAVVRQARNNDRYYDKAYYR